MGRTDVDYLIVGSGLTGSTVARVLADHGREVLILDRREHIGGNVHDTVHPSGIRVHSYGPHYFRCSSPRVWKFVNRFSEFRPYEPEVKTSVVGVLEDWPPNQRSMLRFGDAVMRQGLVPPRNFEEACLRKVPPQIYETFIKGYTRRQWGVEPDQLSPDLARRIRVNHGDHRTLTPHHPYQGLPTEGYAAFTANLTAGIPIRLGVDYRRQREDYRARKLLVYTGSLDEFFDFDEGRLAYRSQRRVHTFFEKRERLQPCVQVNHADAGARDPLRTIEWKHLLPPESQPLVRGTLVTQEFPFSATRPDECEYPFPDATNQALYQCYRVRARRVPRLLACGRLGEYQYHDMDHAIGRALVLAQRILDRSSRSAPQHNLTAQVDASEFAEADLRRMRVPRPSRSVRVR